MADLRNPQRWNLASDFDSQFDTVTAHLCAWASYYAYFENAETYFRNLLGATNIFKIAANPNTGLPQGFILELSECNLVVFAGTTDYTQIYGHVRAPLYTTLGPLTDEKLCGYQWGRHQTGIVLDYDTQLDSAVVNKKTIFTGHSFGGAIASALLACMRARNVVGALGMVGYSFGCPRIGNKAMAVAVGTSFNCIVSGDIVPKLPHAGLVRPAVIGDPLGTYSVWPTDPFTNHGTIVYVYHTGAPQVCTPGALNIPQETPIEYDASLGMLFSRITDSAGIQPRSVTQLWNEGIAKHRCGNYLTALEKQLPDGGDFESGITPLAIIVAEKTLQEPTPNEEIRSTIHVVPPAPPSVDPGVVPLRKRIKH